LQKIGDKAELFSNAWRERYNLFLSCNTSTESYGCVTCISCALKVKIMDSKTQIPVTDARIVVTNNRHDTLTYCDTCHDSSFIRSTFDSTYNFPGLPGKYQIQFSHPDYDAFTISNIEVTQWSEVTCEHANTKNMVIQVDKKSLNKLTEREGYIILEQSEKEHCM
jgi:hypothetical protein